MRAHQDLELLEAETGLDVMPQKGGDPAAELCQEALMWSMVLDEVILNLEG